MEVLTYFKIYSKIYFYVLSQTIYPVMNRFTSLEFLNLLSSYEVGHSFSIFHKKFYVVLLTAQDFLTSYYCYSSLKSYLLGQFQINRLDLSTEFTMKFSDDDISQSIPSFIRFSEPSYIASTHQRTTSRHLLKIQKVLKSLQEQSNSSDPISQPIQQ